MFSCVEPHQYVFQEGIEPSDCSDGIDNDDEGVTDCEDPKCEDSTDCGGDSGEQEDSGSVEVEDIDQLHISFWMMKRLASNSLSINENLFISIDCISI